MWQKIAISPSELSLARVLRCGQTFRWKQIDGVWFFTTSDRLVLLKQDPSNLYYSQVLKNETEPATSEEAYAGTLAFLNDYFNLNTKLSDLYSEWNGHHRKFHPKKVSPFDAFPGIRILRQDPWETTVSFICSSNNNVKRISKMCDALCVHFGEKLADYADHIHYSFPSAVDLAQPGVEKKLRDLGFGYRAKYINQTAQLLTSSLSIDALNSLRDEPHANAHEYLLQLTGVGPKVADCICLMALDKHDCVPVDTHVYQIALRDYKFKGKRDLKTLNKQTYSAIRQHFVDIFGPYAGWAQSVLFASDLSDLNNGVNVESTVKVKDDTVEVVSKIEVKADTVETVEKIEVVKVEA
ncbi:N-glycosylase/DNA lyase [Diutina catenulata]